MAQRKKPQPPTRPSIVWIAEHPVEIVWVKETLGDNDNWAEWRENELKIVAYCDAPPTRLASTLYHELRHAVCSFITPWNRKYKDEEEYVRTEECTMFPVFRDERNRPFWRFVLGLKD